MTYEGRQRSVLEQQRDQLVHSMSTIPSDDGGREVLTAMVNGTMLNMFELQRFIRCALQVVRSKDRNMHSHLTSCFKPPLYQCHNDVNCPVASVLRRTAPNVSVATLDVAIAHYTHLMNSSEVPPHDHSTSRHENRYEKSLCPARQDWFLAILVKTCFSSRMPIVGEICPVCQRRATSADGIVFVHI